MLEKVGFNYKLFRYRREDAEQGIAYNLRYGNIVFLKGKTKRFIESLYANDFIDVNSENKVVQELKKLGVIYSKETYDEDRIK
jgi:hypothetical protein